MMRTHSGLRCRRPPAAVDGDAALGGGGAGPMGARPAAASGRGSRLPPSGTHAPDGPAGAPAPSARRCCSGRPPPLGDTAGRRQLLAAGTQPRAARSALQVA